MKNMTRWVRLNMFWMIPAATVIMLDGSSALASGVKETEPNNSVKKANAIPLNVRIDAVNPSSGDQDYFRFTISECGELRLVSVRPPNVSAGLAFSLLTASGASIETVDIIKEGEQAFLTRRLDPGDYILRAYNRMQFSGLYWFRLDFTPEAPPSAVVPASEPVVAEAPAVAAPTPAATPETAPPTKNVATILEEIAQEKSWTNRISAPTPEFRQEISRKFVDWCLIMTDLEQQGRAADADKIAQAIVNLRRSWGTLFPKNMDGFVRDSFTVGQWDVVATQFFEPVPFYGQDNGQENIGNLVKLYRFSVFPKGTEYPEQVTSRYYLERSHIENDYFVLGRTQGAHHTQVQPYGSQEPSYRRLRDDVIVDLRQGHSSISAR